MSEQVLINNQSTIQANFDAKKYICGPWLKGARGGPWALVFKPAFEDALRSKTDNFSSLYEHIVTETAFGAANGPAHPAGAGLAALEVQSRAAYRTRGENGYSLILSHIGHDQDVHDKIKNHVATVLTGAPTAAAVVAANAAIAAANAANLAAIAAGNPPVAAIPPAAAGVAGALPADWLAQLYRWIDTNLANARPSGLLTMNQDDEFQRLKLTDVGIDRDTLSRFHMLLNRTNNQRQVPKPLIEVWIKFLSQITFPKLIADEAVKQLQTPTFVIPAGMPNAGQVDLPALVTNFEELWHAIYDRGVEIKPQAAPRPPPDRSNRVDGMMNMVHNIHESDLNRSTSIIQEDTYDWTGLSASELHEAHFVSTNGGEAFAFLKNERNCWVCKGYGHTKQSCPSDQKVKRPISACIKGLESLKAIEDSRFQQLRRRPISRRPGRSPGARPTAREAATVSEQLSEPLIQYDDGGIYTSDGIEVVAPPVVAESSTAGIVAPPGEPSQQVQVEDHASTVVSNSASTTPAQGLDSLIEKDFQSSFGYSVEAKHDSFEYSSPTTKSMAKGAIITAAAILGVAAFALRSVRGRAVLTLLTLATGCKGMEMRPEPIKVHTSEYSRSNMNPVSHLNGTSTTSRDHGTMDTGTTECTSGRRKLFPNDKIEQHNPPIRVEVASGVSLPVLFKGVMSMRIRPQGTTSSKKFVTIDVPHSLYVPKMPVTLVSTKALFEYCNIRTYFNDELCMIMPDGARVEFVETPTNYTVLFADDDTPVHATRTARKQSPMPDNSVAQTARTTLRNPLPLTWDLAHERFCHFNPERIAASKEYITGQDIASLGTPSRNKAPCTACIRGSFKGHRHGHRKKGTFTRFAQRIYSDSCAMPKSTPFGYVEMYIFYDACTKYIAAYYGKTTKAWEMLLAFQTFTTDHKTYMPKGHVEEWYGDGGPEFKSPDTEKLCAEMHTRRQFIAPWNPWMNVAETGWRIILRPLRIILAANNVSKAFWPFAVNAIIQVHNALSTSSDTSSVSDQLSSAAVAFALSFSVHTNPSPYYKLSRRHISFLPVE